MSRILVITNSYPNKGDIYNGVYVKRHVLFHRELGVDVQLIAPNDSRRGTHRVMLKYSKLLIRVLGWMLFGRFDLVHAHWPIPSGLFALVLSKVRNKPFVLTSHGSFVDDYSSHSWIVRKLTKFVLSHADRVIAVSTQHKKNLITIANLFDKQISTIGMGIKIPENISKEKARQILGINFSDRILIYIGNLEKNKGLDVLIKAINRLDRNRFQIRLFIGGQGPEKKRIEEAITSSHLERFVHFIGPIPPDEVPVWLAASDICIIPSFRESFGLVAIEAMASGTPVIASDVGGLSENIEDGFNGLLFPVGNHQTLAAKIELLLDDDEMAERLSTSGKKYANDLDYELKASEVLNIYDELLS